MKHSAGTGSKKNTYHRLVATNPSAHNTLNWHKEDQNSLACSKKSMKNKFNESNTHHNSELQNYLKCEWQLLKVQILTCIAWHRKRHKNGLQQISSNSKLTVRANFFILYPDLYVNSMKFHLLWIQKKKKFFLLLGEDLRYVGWYDMLLNYLLFHGETWECNNYYHHTWKNNNVRENVRLIEHGSMSSTVSYFPVSRISWGENRAVNVVFFFRISTRMCTTARVAHARTNTKT